MYRANINAIFHFLFLYVISLEWLLTLLANIIIVVVIIIIYANKVIGFYSYIRKFSFFQDYENASFVVQGFREETKRC